MHHDGDTFRTGIGTKGSFFWVQIASIWCPEAREYVSTDEGGLFLIFFCSGRANSDLNETFPLYLYLGMTRVCMSHKKKFNFF